MSTKNIVAFSFLIVALSIAYYFVIFLPSIEKNKLKLEESSQEDDVSSKVLLDECLNRVKNNMTSVIETRCKDKTSDNCIVPDKEVKLYTDIYESEKNDCFKKFPQK